MTNPIFNTNAITSKIIETSKVLSNSDPLQQFEVVTFPGLAFLEFTNLSFVLLLNVALAAAFLASFNMNMTNNYDFATKSIYQLVQSMVKENLFIKKQQYFSVLFYLFITLLLANLIGLLPYSFTVTSSFIVTLFISMMHFAGVNILGASQHG
jgi:F0F1-type ATP synthase membrane subunit a